MDTICRRQALLWGALALALALPALARIDYRLGIVHGGHFELFEKAGIGWTRVDFTRNGIERKPGQFDWKQQDEFVSYAAKHGVKVLPILDYAAAWDTDPNKGPATDEERASFANFVYQTVKHFEGRIEAWEIWNEPDIGFWKPDPNARDYALLLKACYQAIKRADPNARVVGGSLAEVNPRFLSDMCKHGAAQYMDVLSIHPYRYSNNPEIKFAGRIERLRDVLRKYGKGNMPVWITEIGWGSGGKGLSEADQANYFIRSYLTSLAAGVEVYMWFNFIDDPRYNSPVFPHGDQVIEKPVMWAIKTCTDMLAGAEYVGMMPWQDPDYGLIFRRGNEIIIAAWRRYGTATRTAPFFGRAADQYGRTVAEKTNTLTLTESVGYLYVRAAQGRTQSPALRGLVPRERRRVVASGTPSAHPPVKWRVHSEEAWYSSPAVGDVNGDGKQEVVIASGDVRALLCFGTDGKELWRVKAENPIPSSPALADLDGDGKLEALIGTNDKALWCVDGAGNVRWKAPLEDNVGDSAATACDLDGDGKPEILVGADSIVYCFDAQGKERWRYAMLPLRDQKEAPKIQAPLACGDADGDGKPNIVLGASDGSVRCLDDNGRELWRVMETSEPCVSGPVIGDLDRDGSSEIVVALDARTLYCLRGGDGKELWRFPAAGRIFTTIALGDINSDGKAEVVFGDYRERLYCLSHDGRLLWQWNAFGKIKAAPVLADVDGDKRIEILVGDGQGWFTCLGRHGKIKWRFTSENDDEILESAAVADLDCDGKLEVVFGCKHGDIECLSLPGAPNPDLMPWPSRRPFGRP
jgi:outer membrane protein assembly factor BamB